MGTYYEVSDANARSNQGQQFQCFRRHSVGGRGRRLDNTSARVLAQRNEQAVLRSRADLQDLPCLRRAQAVQSETLGDARRLLLSPIEWPAGQSGLMTSWLSGLARAVPRIQAGKDESARCLNSVEGADAITSSHTVWLKTLRSLSIDVGVGVYSCAGRWYRVLSTTCHKHSANE